MQEITSNHVEQTGYAVAALLLKKNTGIPITPQKECMIDGSESPNANESFDSGIAYQRNWWYYIIIQAKCIMQ